MRKQISAHSIEGIMPSDQDWLDLENMAQAELTSEDPSYPIESALIPDVGPGWRASEPGRQTVRLIFDDPLHIRRIRLVFKEDEQQRAQEFVLRWSADGLTYWDILRQQYNFSPPETTIEIEDYTVDLNGVSALEITIIPNIGGGTARASIEQLRLAS